MFISRTIFKKEIICEFLPPARKTKRQKVIILCPGAPGAPRRDEVLKLISKKGFWVFNPRYRGTWESHGKFLKKSPHQDILDIISELPKGFSDSKTEKKIRLKPEKIFLIGSSFGGPAAILASKDKRVEKVFCFSPVIDWSYPSKEEPLDLFGKFIRKYFGRAYDFDLKNWKKLEKGNFYNPISETENLDGRKIFIIHAKDDRVVSYKPTFKFAKLTGARLKLLRRGGHFGTRYLLVKNQAMKDILKFFNTEQKTF